MRRAIEAACKRHQALALLVENMLLLMKQALDRKAVHRQFSARTNPIPHGLDRDGEQFRIEPGARLLLPCKENLNLLTSRVDGVVALVLVVVKRREIPDPVAESTHRIHRAERRKQVVGTLDECAPQRGERGNFRLQIAVGQCPLVPVEANRRQIPRVARRNRVAWRQRPLHRAKDITLGHMTRLR